MAIPKNEACLDCKFFEKFGAIGSGARSERENRLYGACRRYAPRGVWPTRLADGAEETAKSMSGCRDDVTGYYFWPMVNENDWCGEYLEQVMLLPDGLPA